MSSETDNNAGASTGERRGEWKEVVRLTFKGEAYADDTLDLTALEKLAQFHKLVRQTAKELWRSANPHQGRVMDPRVQDQLEALRKKDPEVEFLIQEHRALDKKVSDLFCKSFLTPEEDAELLRLKKEKLRLKDRLEAMIHQDASARSIEEIIAELANQVPREEWDRLPSDLSDNLDHYLYGSPKR